MAAGRVFFPRASFGGTGVTARTRQQIRRASRYQVPLDGLDSWLAFKHGEPADRKDAIIGVCGNYALFGGGWG